MRAELGKPHAMRTVAGAGFRAGWMAAALSLALGETVRHVAVTPETYRGFGFPGADDLGNMFQFNHDFATEFCAARDLELSRRLNPEMQNLEAWLAENESRIALS